jgi:hypothetical protein
MNNMYSLQKQPLYEAISIRPQTLQGKTRSLREWRGIQVYGVYFGADGGITYLAQF